VSSYSPPCRGEIKGLVLVLCVVEKLVSGDVEFETR